MNGIRTGPEGRENSWGQIARRVRTNASKIGAAALARTGLGLVTTAVVARSLGPLGLGMVTMVASYIKTVDSVTDFQSWQAIVRFGAEYLASGEEESFGSMVRGGFVLDIVTGVLATAVAFGLVPFVAHLLKWSPEAATGARLYALAIPFAAIGTARGILRLRRRFAFIAYQTLAAAVIRLAAVLLVVERMHGGVLAVVVAYAISEAIANALYMAGAVHELWRSRLRRYVANGAGAKFLQSNGDFTRFALSSSVNGSLRVVVTQVDALLVGGVLGARDVGLYKIVKVAGTAAQRIANPISEALYPELAAIAAAGKWDQLRAVSAKMVIRLGALVLVGWSGAVIFGRWGIGMLGGGAYQQAYVPLLVYLVGAGLRFASLPLGPLLLALGVPGRAIPAYLFGAIAFVVAVPTLGLSLGLPGACAGLAAFYLVWIAYAGQVARRRFKLVSASLP